MVAAAGQAESVLYGDGKAAAALKSGSVVLLMATVGPAAVEDWEALGIPALIAQNDLVITGEGRFDSQSLAGKVSARQREPPWSASVFEPGRS